MKNFLIIAAVGVGIYFLINRAQEQVKAQTAARLQANRAARADNPIINPITGKERVAGGGGRVSKEPKQAL